jgi:GH15 family glucan-1,4-alpha-glucosidase
VFGGLTAASLFCTVFGETERADRYRTVAAEIRDAASTHLWRPELGRFCRMVSYNGTDELLVDGTSDASLWGLFAFGLYRADDPRIIATIDALREKLWVKTPVGGMARYENDIYHRVSTELPGNPWFIATLWLADHLIAKAGNEAELAEAVELLNWCGDHALPSGVLAEQVHPFTGQPLSVSPLTWSHATFVATTQHYIRSIGKLRSCPECGLSLTAPSRSEDWIEKLFSQACDAIHGICRV